MSLVANIQLLAARVAAECKSIRTLVNGNAADLSALNTAAKTNLVAAVNELKTAIDAIPNTAIDDSATSATKTWSSTKISAQITSAINALVNGAPAALDTLNQLATALQNDEDAVATLTAQIAGAVRFDIAQTLTGAQQLQANTNLGIGDPTIDFVAAFNAGLA